MGWRKNSWGLTPCFGRGYFDERAFNRASLPNWDVRWHHLSVAARASFLDEVKIPPGKNPLPHNTPSTGAGRFSAAVLKELTHAGLVELHGALGDPDNARVVAAGGAQDFALRMRILRRFRLLDRSQTKGVKEYVDHNYFQNDLKLVLLEVLSKVGIRTYLTLGQLLEDYVQTHRWVDWIAATLEEPLAAPIVEQVIQAGGMVSLAELVGKVKKAEPAEVRLAVDQLVAHLALFEDLDPVTHDLCVGVLPSIREALIGSRRPRWRPPLVMCSRVKDVGPDEGHVISDLRAYLLELASAPARLKQDRSLFQKEVQRFENVLEPLPDWLGDALRTNPTRRLGDTMRMAKNLNLVKEVRTGKAWYLHPSSKGEEWLIESIDDQFLEVLATYRPRPKPSGAAASKTPGLIAGYDSDGYPIRDDTRFLGANVVSVPVPKEGRVLGVWERNQESRDLLRYALDKLISALPSGVFHPMESFVDHAVFGEHNPLLLGTGPGLDRVTIFWNENRIPPLADRLEDIARTLLLDLLGLRLIPLGCVRIAIDDQGGIAIARDPRFDAYFGRPIARGQEAAAGTLESKVVVQPDYSVVIIGSSAAPAADLLPFCVRTSSGAGRGALVLKITKESVLQAIGRGLPPGEVLVRLKRHASHDLPANVVREVEGWASWVRHVSVERLTVICCPDRETADRVMGALHKNAERIHETMVTVALSKLTPVEHQKLLGQGILVGSEAGEVQPLPESKPKPKAKTRKKRRSVY